MKQSAIGWTDYSGGNLNFVTGCTPISAGCANCYARSIYERFGKDFGKVTIHPKKLARLAKERFGLPVKDAAGNVLYLSHKRYGSGPMCFVCDTGDLFHEAVPDRFLDAVFNVLEERDDVTWQILTKRAERMATYVSMRAHWDTGPLPPHVWVGVTVENQKAADERIPLLLDTLAAVRFVSVEPMLGWVDLERFNWLGRMAAGGDWRDYAGRVVERGNGKGGAQAMQRKPSHYLDWVVCGGESGPNRRPFDAEWARLLYEDCHEAGVPFFFKQSGGLKPGTDAVLPGVGVVQEWPA